MPRCTKLKSIRVPRYCLHKPTGQAYVTLGGKMVYLGKYNLTANGEPDCPRYHQLIAEWLANGRTAPPTPPTPESPLTIAELLAQYWAHCETYYKNTDGKPTGELYALKDALRPVNKLFGDAAAQDFGPKKLKMVRDAMKKCGWCRTNINRQVSRVKRCFKWGVEEELVPGSVHHALSAVKPLRCNPDEVRESEPVRPVAEGVVNAMIPFLAPTLQSMVQLQALTGMRPGELVTMRMADIEMDGDRWTYRPVKHKNSHRGLKREIPLGPKAREILRPFLKPGKLDAFLFDPRKVAPHSGRSACYNVTGYRRSIARACDRAFPLTPALEKEQQRLQEWVCKWAYAHNNYRPKLTEHPPELLEIREKIEAFRAANRWHPHQLRHSAATALRKRFGLEQARVVLGHTDTTMTGVYAEEDREQARAIMEQVG